MNKTASLAPVQIGLRYRFGEKDPFAYPSIARPVMGPKKSASYMYLDLGETLVRENRLSFEIDFSPSVKEQVVIKHVRFTPPGKGKDTEVKKGEEEKMEKRLKSLKALGYYVE